MKIRSAAIALLALITISCSQPKASEDQAKADATPTPKQLSREEKRELPIDKANISDVYPTADGGAYIVSLHGQVWYARGSSATRVTEDGVRKETMAPLRPGDAFTFVLLSAERQRVRKLQFENAELQEKLDKAEAKLEESTDDQ